MKIACIGGGPGGLYFAISAKHRNPDHEIHVYERNRPDDTFGWGVVFSDQTLENLRENDPISAERIFAAFHHWDHIDIHFKGERIRSSGHGFAGLSRKKILLLLQERARELGVHLHFQVEVDSLADVGEHDLFIACDGLNSKIRTEYAEHFEPDIEMRKNKFIWLGTHKTLDAFTFIFEKTEHGWVQVHGYRFDEDTSTFIIECTEKTWRALGIDKMSKAESNRFCEKLFADYLDGHALMDNAAHLQGTAWLTFPRISNRTWYQREHRPSRRFGAYRAFFHWLRHQARSRGRDRACESDRGARRAPRRTRGLPESARARRAPASERGAQQHGMVRERRSLRAVRAATIRLLPSHAKSAREPRQFARPRRSVDEPLRRLVCAKKRSADGRTPYPVPIEISIRRPAYATDFSDPSRTKKERTTTVV